MQIRNLTKIYTSKSGITTVGLNDVSLTLPDKGFAVILGKSGCGKSTLLNILGGLDTPTSGSIMFDDTDIAKFSSVERDTYRENNVGFIFQNFNLFEQLNVYENITFCMPNASKSEENEIDELLEKLEISECKYKRINELSGGQQQRVSICRALMKNCKILLADEPTGNLDQVNGKVIFDILKRCAEDKLVLAVTHDRDIAEQYADYIIELNDGKLVGITERKDFDKTSDMVIDMTPNKSHGSLKSNTKMSVSFLIKKKLKMIFSMVLMAVSLAVMAVTYMCYQFDIGEIGAGVLMADNDKYMSVTRGYWHPDTDKYMSGNNLPIKEDVVNGLIKKYDLTDVDVAYSPATSLEISRNNTGSKFFSNYINTIIASSDKGLAKYGFTMKYGKYPENNNEAAVPDMLANSIVAQRPMLIAKLLGVYSIEQLMDDAILSQKLLQLDEELLIELFGANYAVTLQLPETLSYVRENYGMILLNQDISFGNKEFKITGIIDTEYMELYGNIMNGSVSDDAMQQELMINSGKFYNSLFVTKKAIADGFYSDAKFIEFSNGIARPLSEFDRATEFPELKSGEILMSRNYFKSYFGEDYNPAKSGTYIFKSNISMTLVPDKLYETFYESEHRVVGVFDDREDPEVIFNDEDFDNRLNGMMYVKYVHFDKPTDKGDVARLVNDLLAEDMSYRSSTSYFVYEIMNIMNIFKLVFIILSGVLGVFSAIMFYNYFSMLIESQKKEIGIMRALGTSYKRIYMICFLAGIMISVVTILLSWVLTGILGVIADNVLIGNLVKFSAMGSVKGLHVLTFTVVPFILSLVIGTVISLLAILLPNYKIKKMLPINAIHNE